jgi:uncharacterized protein (TIGR00375 family)
MDIKNMAKSAKIKGLQLVGTGDAIHPKYHKEIRQDAEETEGGFLEREGIFFAPSVEINNVFEQPQGKKRRVHMLVVFPSIEIAEKFSDLIAPFSKLGSDGRPWVKMSLKELAKNSAKLDPKILLIPAHIWTPWYGIFGSKGGFSSLHEAFEEQEKSIYAVETGLSSDPPMNWRCSWLDKVRILSFSDAHSPENLAREATEFEIERMQYDCLWKAIAKPDAKNHVLRTIEFFPQEGKYYTDGHRACGLRLSPDETKKMNGRCPKCGKKITRGVLGRIDLLADRKEGEKPKNALSFSHLIPLRKLIAMALGRGEKAKEVEDAYYAILGIFGNEIAALESSPKEMEEKLQKNLEIEKCKKISKAVFLMQQEKLELNAGFDGQYGEIKLPEY